MMYSRKMSCKGWAMYHAVMSCNGKEWLCFALFCKGLADHNTNALYEGIQDP